MECDESVFGKRKYNKGTKEGHRLMWVFGGVCRETQQCFLVICPGGERSMEVLDEIVLRHVHLGNLNSNYLYIIISFFAKAQT